MATIAVSAAEFADVAPEVVFDQFGRPGEGGWLFGAVCDRVESGAAVAIRVPIADGPPVEILGRISDARRPLAVTVVHDQPWRGRIRLRFRAAAGGTSIRLHAEIDEAGFEWLMRRRGLALHRAPATGPRIGVLTSRSGPGSLFAAAVGNVAGLTVDELNAGGGIGDRPIEVLLADDATDAGTGVLEAHRLAREGCGTIFLTTTSATWQAVSAALEGTGTLLVQTNMNEGDGQSRLRIRLGERPATQLSAAAPTLMRSSGGRRWFLAGNAYVWPRVVNGIARSLLPAQGGRIVGERYAPLGTRDYGPVVDAITASGADIVLNTFVGADGAAFERQCHAMGLRDRTVSLGPAMDEATLEHVGEDAAAGIFGVSGYFQHLQNERNADLVRRYRTRFGRFAPPLSTQSESLFEALHVWAAAARRIGTVEPGRVADEMRAGRFEVPRGTIDLGGDDGPPLHLAAARGSAFVAAD